MPSPVVTAGLGVILVWILLKLSRRGSREAGLPPGPPTLPLLGNLHQFPKGGVHTKYVSMFLFLRIFKTNGNICSDSQNGLSNGAMYSP